MRMHLLNHPRRLSQIAFPAGQMVCALALLCVSGSLAWATTVSEYHERVNTAVRWLNDVAPEPAKTGATDQSQNVTPTVANNTSTVFEQLRDLLPPKETVEVSTGSLEVNNQWLHDALSEYEKTPPGRLRQERLSRIKDRLESLAVRLTEMEKATTVASEDKTSKQARLQEILRRSEYQKKSQEKGALAKLWDRFVKWLNSLFPEAKPIEPGQGAMTISKGAQIFVVLLALAVIAYVAWKLLPALFRKGKRSRKRGKREARIVLGETLEPDQTAGDLLADAEALARAGDLRAAIRKAYIALLCELGDRKIIRLAQHKTNRDYLSAVREMPPLHEEMRNLTRSFESHWYGFMPATETEWTNFRSGYHRALSAERSGS